MPEQTAVEAQGGQHESPAEEVCSVVLVTDDAALRNFCSQAFQEEETKTMQLVCIWCYVPGR